MPTPIARVRRATLHAIAPDTPSALSILHIAESALPRALEAAASSVGEEMLVIRRIELAFAVQLEGHSAPSEGQLELSLRRSFTRALLAVRGGSDEPLVTPQVAWFPNEAVAVAEVVVAQAEGRGSAWPYSSLTQWGATPSDVLRTSLARGRPFLGDALGWIGRRLAADRLSALVPDDLASLIIPAWTDAGGTGGGERSIAASALPADLRTAIAAYVARAAGASPVQRDFATLAQLLALWPPARDSQISLDVIRELATAERGHLDRAVDADERKTRVPLQRLVSAAGGLLAWAVLFDREELSASIAAAYPLPRAERAVRWAVGRALEDPGVGNADPLLLLWAGEDPTTFTEPSRALAAADPEPLHRLAIAAAARRGLFAAPLEAAPFGDLVVLTGETGFCVDAIPIDRGPSAGSHETAFPTSPHDAIPEIARKFARRSGAPPAGIRVSTQMRSEHADSLVEVDVPPLPEAWRIAVRAFASLARDVLRQRWRARMSDLRRWPGIVEIGPRTAVELRRSDVSRTGDGDRLATGVSILGGSLRVRIV
jgi:hypothetical protein